MVYILTFSMWLHLLGYQKVEAFRRELPHLLAALSLLPFIYIPLFVLPFWRCDYVPFDLNDSLCQFILFFPFSFSVDFYSVYMHGWDFSVKQVNTNFALDLEPTSSCYPTFLLHLMVKLLDSSHCFHFWSLICSSSALGWLFISFFTETASAKITSFWSHFFDIFFSDFSFFLSKPSSDSFWELQLFSLSLKCRSFPRFGLYLDLLLFFTFCGQSGPHAQDFNYCLYLLHSDTNSILNLSLDLQFQTDSYIWICHSHIWKTNIIILPQHIPSAE